jgi:S1-C subfamily serine protease
VGDIILELNGEKVEGKSEFKAMLAEMAAGDSLEVKLTRDGEPMTIKLKLGKR